MLLMYIVHDCSIMMVMCKIIGEFFCRGRCTVHVVAKVQRGQCTVRPTIVATTVTDCSGLDMLSIVTWCADRGVDVYACTIAETQYFGTCYARVSVAEEFEQTLLDKEFWPDTIAHTVRKWRYADSASK